MLPRKLLENTAQKATNTDITDKTDTEHLSDSCTEHYWHTPGEYEWFSACLSALTYPLKSYG
jgi:hypothetical protein